MALFPCSPTRQPPRTRNGHQRTSQSLLILKQDSRSFPHFPFPKERESKPRAIKATHPLIRIHQNVFSFNHKYRPAVLQILVTESTIWIREKCIITGNPGNNLNEERIRYSTAGLRPPCSRETDCQRREGLAHFDSARLVWLQEE